MDPGVYDSWYRTARGSWIGETEYALLKGLITPVPGATLIDAGCGTGYFTRRFAMDGARVTGIDPDPAMIRFAQSQRAVDEMYSVADARALPFGDGVFDLGIAITSFCFIREQKLALSELVRVTRGRIALGLLNRHSLLYWQKGRRGGAGAYRGAHWHTPAEAVALFAGLPVKGLTVHSAIHLPHATGLARRLDQWLQGKLFFGSFLVITGEIAV
ncbi:MAG: class I SAM-dependent methyltransferase [Sulfuriferula sp.]